MDADDQNVEAGIMGAGSGKPPASRRAFPPGAAAGRAAVPGTMRAVVLDAPGPPSALAIRELPVPVPTAGQVLIKVRAFGLNRLELYLRLGLSEGVTFLRVPGIEAVGVVAECPGGEFSTGQQVAALMGGMGRVFDGGYADYTLRPRRPGDPVPQRPALGHPRGRPGDAADLVRVADHGPGRPSRAVHPDPRRHLLGRAGHGGPGPAARDDRPGHHP